MPHETHDELETKYEVCGLRVLIELGWLPLFLMYFLPFVLLLDLTNILVLLINPYIHNG
jgi:hypothetical protein